MAMHTPLGSSDLILSMGTLETCSTGDGSTEVQHHSGSRLKTDASEHHHVFTAVLQQVALSVHYYIHLLAISDSISSSDHKVPPLF